MPLDVEMVTTLLMAFAPHVYERIGIKLKEMLGDGKKVKSEELSMVFLSMIAEQNESTLKILSDVSKCLEITNKYVTLNYDGIAKINEGVNTLLLRTVRNKI